jgi:hypothetical protein
MYDVYLDKVLLPITPSKLQLKVKNQNKTINLINEGEINLLKQAGLTDISLTVIIPQTQYPFAGYKSGFQGASFFLDAFEKLKTERDGDGKLKPFQFIISRATPNGKILFDSNIKVSMEDYVINEGADNGFDLSVDIKLKQYRPYATKTVEIKEPPKPQDPPKAEIKQDRPAETAPQIGIGSNVIVNGRLHRDSYGQGAGQTRTNYRGKINFINMKGSHPYHVTTPDGGWLGWVTKDSVRAV